MRLISMVIVDSVTMAPTWRQNWSRSCISAP